MMPGRADSCKGINDDFDVSRLCFINDGFKTLISTEHLICLISRCDSEWRGFIFPILCLVGVLVLEWVIVSLKSSHKIEGRYSLLCVVVDAVLYVFESSSLYENILVFVKLGVLIVDLDFMESMISDASCVSDESSLGKTYRILIGVLIILIVVITAMTHWEHWFWLSENLAR